VRRSLLPVLPGSIVEGSDLVEMCVNLDQEPVVSIPVVECLIHDLVVGKLTHH